MHWTWLNLVFFLVGTGGVVGCCCAIRFRVQLLKFFLEQQTALFGSWFGNVMKRGTTPISGIVVPAIGGIAIGVVFVLVGIFGHPQIV